MSLVVPARSLGFVGTNLVRFLTPTGVVLGNINVTLGLGFPSNGNIVQLPTGEIAIATSDVSHAGTVKFFDSQLTPVASATITPNQPAFASGCNGTAEFTFLNSTGARRFNPDGTVLDNKAIANTPDTLATNLAGTTLYSCNTADHDVYKTVAGVTSSFRNGGMDVVQGADPAAILVLQDGTVLSNWYADGTILGYLVANDPAGVELWTWSYGVTSNADYMSFMARGADATYFWAGVYFGTANNVVVYKINASDGSILSQFTKPQTDGTIDYSSTALLEINTSIGTASVTDINVDCPTKNITITSTDNFPYNPIITLTLNGNSVSFTIILISLNQIVIHPDTFANGTWCVLVQ